MATLWILTLGADGNGPEVLDAGLHMTHVPCDGFGVALSIEHDLLDGAAWDAFGTFYRDTTVQTVGVADAVLVCAVDGPHSDVECDPGGPETHCGLPRTRDELNTCAGYWSARSRPSSGTRMPFAPVRMAGLEVLVQREMRACFMSAWTHSRSRQSGMRCAIDVVANSLCEGRAMGICHPGLSSAPTSRPERSPMRSSAESGQARND